MRIKRTNTASGLRSDPVLKSMVSHASDSLTYSHPLTRMVSPVLEAFYLQTWMGTTLLLPISSSESFSDVKEKTFSQNRGILNNRKNSQWSMSQSILFFPKEKFKLASLEARDYCKKSAMIATTWACELVGNAAQRPFWLQETILVSEVTLFF